MPEEKPLLWNEEALVTLARCGYMEICICDPFTRVILIGRDQGE